MLLYHGVPRHAAAGGMDADIFETHLLLLKRHYTFIRAEDFGTTNGSFLRPPVLLTLDDGMRNHADVVAPILRRHQVAAVFFICSRHCSPGQYLWFTHLRMLARYFQGELKLNGSRINFGAPDHAATADRATRALLALAPRPQAMYAALAAGAPRLEEFVPPSVLRDECEGMRPEQIRQLADDPLFTVGGHTCDHPFLTRCTPEEVERQIMENKVWLEAITGKSCDVFAYPHGVFTAPIADTCRRIEFRYAFAVERRHLPETAMSVTRVGVYRLSPAVLGVRVACGRLLYTWPIKQLRSLSRHSARGLTALQHRARALLGMGDCLRPGKQEGRSASD